MTLLDVEIPWNTLIPPSPHCLIHTRVHFASSTSQVTSYHARASLQEWRWSNFVAVAQNDWTLNFPAWTKHDQFDTFLAWWSFRIPRVCLGGKGVEVGDSSLVFPWTSNRTWNQASPQHSRTIVTCSCNILSQKLSGIPEIVHTRDTVTTTEIVVDGSCFQVQHSGRGGRLIALPPWDFCCRLVRQSWK